MLLKCILILNAPSSYSNLWWRDALVKSREVNGDHNLRVLTEEHLGIDVVRPMPSRYIDYPVLNDGVKLEDGFYHLNIQTTSKLFTGFMHVQDGSALWWGQGTGSGIYAGYAGNYDVITTMFDDYNRQIYEWVGAATYQEQLADETDLSVILKS